MKRIKPNIDKPHRCPRCHTIPDAARKDGKAVPNKIYECSACDVFWKMTRTDYRILKQIKAALERRLLSR